MEIHQLMLGVVLVSGCSGTIDVGPSPGAGGVPGSSVSTGASGAMTASGAAAASTFDGPACTDANPLPTWPSSSACVPGSNLPIVGTWHGYLENGQTPWDEITLVIKGASVSGGVCGTVAIGSGSLPPPATDPNLGYPLPEPDSAYARRPEFIAGYPLTILDGSSDGTRVQFHYADNESRRSWCQIQTPASSSASDSNYCGCLPPNWGATNAPPNGCKMIDPSGGLHPVSCYKELLCSPITHICACNSAGCDSSMDSGGTFDLRFATDSAEGSASGLGATANAGGRVYFTRLP